MIYYYLPDIETISGGIKQIYRHINILNSSGYDAKIFYENLNVNNQWFNNNCPKENDIESIKESDYIVFPEISCGNSTKFLKYTKNIIIFNQNCYYTFTGLNNYDMKYIPLLYDLKFVKSCIVVSDDSYNYLKTCFPNKMIYRVFNGINDKIFYPEIKKNIISCMPRKNKEHLNQIINILSRQKIMKDWEIILIDKMTETQVSQIMNSSKIFLSTGCPEGCPLPPLEAIFSGNVVIGYNGVGGKEYFDKQATVISVEYNNIVDFVNKILRFIELYNNDYENLKLQLHNSIEYYKNIYSIENERKSIITTWKKILNDVI